ncbi:MAG: S4 domain-containing protein [Candidatus Binatia bacterium]
MSDVPMERVAKLMAARGLCSRREAERLIDAGCVLVDGEAVVAQGAKAAPDADIRIADAGARLLGGRATVLLHKPAGVVSTQPELGQTPAWQLVRAATRRGPIDAAVERGLLAEPQSLSAAGRLDRASRGLLVLTQDGTVRAASSAGRGSRRPPARMETGPTDGQVRKLERPHAPRRPGVAADARHARRRADAALHPGRGQEAPDPPLCPYRWPGGHRPLARRGRRAGPRRPPRGLLAPRHR